MRRLDYSQPYSCLYACWDKSSGHPKLTNHSFKIQFNYSCFSTAAMSSTPQQKEDMTVEMRDYQDDASNNTNENITAKKKS